MNIKLDQITPKTENPSVLDRMVLEAKDLEKLPSPERMLADIEQAIQTGKSEASELIKQTSLVEKIKESNGKILFLNKEDATHYIKMIKGLNNPESSDYEELNNLGGMYSPVSKKIGILVNPVDLIAKNNRTKADTISIVSHEIMHSVAKNLKITWLNEAITERLAQGIVSDIIDSSEEWKEVFGNLSDDEDETIRFKTYEEERGQLNELIEDILDKCTLYEGLPKGNYRERNKSESVVFIENFGKAYFSGDLSVLENNLKELGYSSVSELEQLNPNKN